MGTLIDTSVLIALQRGKLDPDRFRSEEDAEPVAMAASTASELLHGVHRPGGAVARTRAERFVEHVLSSIPVIAFDLDIARVHARLDAELSSAGKAVGDADLMIAATAYGSTIGSRHATCAAFPRSRASTWCAGSPGAADRGALPSVCCSFRRR